MLDLVHALNGPAPRTSNTKGSNKQRVRLRPSESQEELRRLVRLWIESGPDLIEMFREEPELELRIRHGRTTFYPMHDGRGHLDWSPKVIGPAQPSFKNDALEDFMILITNPLWELLGGPCSRCGDYYLKKTKRQKVYCSRVCSSKTTAVSTMRQRRQQEHADKIRRAQEAIDDWSKARRRQTWKRWVANRTGCSLNWITRAANNRSLRVPEDAAR
jgi:hypothetical protein